MSRGTSSNASPEPSSPTFPLWQSAWLIALVAALCHIRVLWNSFTYDDLAMIVDNERIRSLLSLRDVWLRDWWYEAGGAAPGMGPTRDWLYRPLTLYSFAVNYALAGLAAWTYLISNVGLHVLATLLVVKLARRILPPQALAAAALAGWLFAVHPIHVEAIAGAVGRAEILASIFLSLGLLAIWPRRIEPDDGGSDRQASIARTVAAAGCFLAALLSKETAICYPALAVVALAAGPILMNGGGVGRVFRDSAAWPAMGVRLMILVIPLLVYMPLRYVALEGRLLRERPTGEMMNPVNTAQGLDRLIAPFSILGRYTELFLLPRNLSSDYGVAIVNPRDGLTVETAIGGAVAILALVGAMQIFSRDARRRLIGLLTWMAIANYALVSNTVLLIGVSMAERLMYWPSAIVLVLLTFLLWSLWKRWEPTLTDAPRALRLAQIGCAVWVVALGSRSAIRTFDWTSNATLFAADVATYPQGAHLNRCHANQLMKEGEKLDTREQQHAVLLDAERYLDRALSIYPRYPEAMALKAQVRHAVGDTERAIALLEGAIQIDPRDAEAQRILNAIRGDSSQLIAQIAELESEIRAAPQRVDLRIEISWRLIEVVRPGDALPHLQVAVEREPRNADAWVWLGKALALMHRKDEAIAAFRECLAIGDDNWEAHVNLSSLLSDRDPAATLSHAQRAYDLNRDSVQTNVNLAEAHALNGARARAVQTYEALLRRLPEHNELRPTLEERLRELKE